MAGTNLGTEAMERGEKENAAVNNKGIPKGESSQIERGEERDRGQWGPPALSTQNIFIELVSVCCVCKLTRVWKRGILSQFGADI